MAFSKVDGVSCRELAPERTISRSKAEKSAALGEAKESRGRIGHDCLPISRIGQPIHESDAHSVVAGCCLELRMGPIASPHQTFNTYALAQKQCGRFRQMRRAFRVPVSVRAGQLDPKLSRSPSLKQITKSGISNPQFRIWPTEVISDHVHAGFEEVRPVADAERVPRI